MSWQRDLVTAYRDHGLDVIEGPGWESFGIGDWSLGRPVAALTHQFVIPYSSPDSVGVGMLTAGYNTGSYFLKPPVANTYLGAAGCVYMIGGRVAQHAGMGVRSVLDRAAADLPPSGDGQNAPGPDNWDAGSFYYWGRETHHPGDLTTYRQYGFLVTMCAAECEVFGWSANRQLEHSNASTRKAQDLISIDGNQLRRDIQSALRGDDTMTEDEMTRAVTAGVRAGNAELLAAVRSMSARLDVVGTDTFTKLALTAGAAGDWQKRNDLVATESHDLLAGIESNTRPHPTP